MMMTRADDKDEDSDNYARFIDYHTIGLGVIH